MTRVGTEAPHVGLTRDFEKSMKFGDGQVPTLNLRLLEAPRSWLGVAEGTARGSFMPGMFPDSTWR